ncbi:MAG: NAD-dependent epimerase/dehydratase family protein [Gammaproteobacteria bacterium]|nr:NAD-dependent epimerase/dehydratase family protein [Gammaproteobacteria bacterium]NIN61677.1 NAD-dependent epimerase/dehydratase family protein [Gammaproteobacteria bacterium]NIO63471.1 NAD-dependent epimerase/dehydratase family protein [Gammaproteobacteria bacterium]NIQ19405.1 NAD-dependent epimerase/dehydratase family protein [Gammaproteobacteria bacterium]NIT05506.1 NAD-dependent epimerase/dehydratase family protein [Gammaproteobacteria bacterium]
MSSKKALIIGITGQDGSYLADYLLKKDYQVFGTSRDLSNHSLINHQRLGIKGKTEITSLSLDDPKGITGLIEKTGPDEIYNLAGQSSVSLSFQKPLQTFRSIANTTLNILETIKTLQAPVRYYNASSSECFGNTNGIRADEETPFKPCSPYATAKSAAHWLTDNYRKAYNIYACSGILFNHESPLRPKNFVTRKIINSVCRIADGSKEKLVLGNINIQRDWGWAPEYVEAMWKMLQQEYPEDYVIATGQTFSLEDFLSRAFAHFDMDWKAHVEFDQGLYRPADIEVSSANPAKANDELAWKARYAMPDVVTKLIESELNSVAV